MFSTAPMNRLGYLGYPNDADVDALLSQLSDESLLKLKVNTHHTSSRGFEYPTFSDGYGGADATEDLDTQLTARLSSLKRPIAPPKKKGKDSLNGGKKVFNSEGRLVGKKGTGDSHSVVGKKSRDSRPVDRQGSDSDVVRWKESGRVPTTQTSRTSSRRREDGSSSSRYPTNKESSRSSSQRSSSRSSDNSAAAGDDDEDPESIDALLNERFRALKASPFPLPLPPSSAPSARNLALDNIIHISGQLSASDYDSYGSPFSTSSSPSTNLLGRSKPRSSPGVMTTSVATSCHCSAPSPLRLLKQVGSRSFPSKQQPSPGSLPPLAPAPRSSTVVKKPGREFQMEGFGSSKPAGKVREKSSKGKKGRKTVPAESNSNNPSTVKDMRRLLSSVADRVGLERSRVSSAVDDEFPGGDLNAWSDGDREFAKASTEEQKLNREAERVVEWAKDAARLEAAESDVDSEADDLGLDDDDDQDSGVRKISKKEKPKKVFKVVPKKKRWGLF